MCSDMFLLARKPFSRGVGRQGREGKNSTQETALVLHCTDGFKGADPDAIRVLTGDAGLDWTAASSAVQ